MRRKEGEGPWAGEKRGGEAETRQHSFDQAAELVRPEPSQHSSPSLALRLFVNLENGQDYATGTDKKCAVGHVFLKNTKPENASLHLA